MMPLSKLLLQYLCVIYRIVVVSVKNLHHSVLYRVQWSGLLGLLLSCV